MQLVLLGLEIFEELADRGHQRSPFVERKIPERHVEPDAAGPGLLFELVQVRSIAGFCPRLDCTLTDGLALVRNHEVKVDIDRVSKPLATRAGAERVIKREKLGFRIFVTDPALLAFERFGESKLLFVGGRSVSSRPVDDFQNDFAVVLAETHLDGIDKALPDVGSDLQTVNENVDRTLEIDVEQRFG